MDKEIFVQNIKKFCVAKGVRPTIACRESGAGINLINKMESRGSIPSVEKVQLLAQYLGVTVSELLGEDASEISLGPAQPDLLIRYNKLSPEDQEEIMAIIEVKLARHQRDK